MRRIINQERGREIVCEVRGIVLNKVVREGITEKIALEQGPRGREGTSHRPPSSDINHKSMLPPGLLTNQPAVDLRFPPSPL